MELFYAIIAFVALGLSAYFSHRLDVVKAENNHLRRINYYLVEEFGIDEEEKVK